MGTTRAARENEAEDVLQTLSAAFGLDADAARPIFYADPFFDLAQKRVLTDETGKTASCLTLIPSNLCIGETRVNMTGIAGVATWPERQKQGFAAELLCETLKMLKQEQSGPLAALFAEQENYYQKFGWETATRSLAWRGPAHRLETGADASNVRTATSEDRPKIHKLHAEMKGQTGSVRRDARRWRVIEDFAPGREILVHEGAGVLDGYALLETLDDLTQIHELLASNSFAASALQAFLARRPGEVLWTLSRPNAALLPPEGSLSDAPGMMVRIVDLRALLTLLHADAFLPTLSETHETLTIQAVDSLLPVNQIPLCLSSQGVFETSFDVSSHRIGGDIRVFSRLVLGDWTPSDAHASGQLQISSPRALALADRLFPARYPFVAIPDQF